MLLIGSNVTQGGDKGLTSRGGRKEGGKQGPGPPLKHFNFFHYPEIKVALLQ